jgi:hypothetical protein
MGRLGNPRIEQAFNAALDKAEMRAVDVCRATGVAEAYFSRVRRGAVVPYMPNGLAIADALGVDARELWGRGQC